MPVNSIADEIKFHIVARSIEHDAMQLALDHFQTKHAGASPIDHSLYVSVEVSLAQVETSVAWITKELAGRYRDLEILIGIQTTRNWAEVMVPAEVTSAAMTYGAEIKVSFMSPPSSSPRSV